MYPRHVGKQRQQATAEEASAVAAMRRAGSSYDQIMSQLGLSRGTVSRILRMAGLITTTTREAPAEASPEPRPGAYTVRKLINHIGSGSARYTDIALPRVSILEVAA